MKTLQELRKVQRPTENLLRDHPDTDPNSWIRLATREMELGDKLYKDNSIDEAYLRYFYAVQLTLEVIPKHKKFSARDESYVQLRSRLSPILSKLESIKATLKNPNPQSYTSLNGTNSQPSSLNSTNSQPSTISLNLNSSKQIITQTLSSQSLGNQLQSTIQNQKGPSPEPSNSLSSGKIPSSGSSQYSSGSPIPPLSHPSSISAVELLTILKTKLPRILIFDIRPTEDFIQGHIGWRSVMSPLSTGLVNIEPDFLKSGLDIAALIELLSSFSASSGDGWKTLIESRSQMDMIVFYDQDSRGFKQNSPLDYLYQTIYYSDMGNAPKILPKVLSGGFVAWKYFLSIEKDFRESDWIEIGQGFGVMPYPQIQPKANYPKPESISSVSQIIGSYSSSSTPSISPMPVNRVNQPMGNQTFNSQPQLTSYSANNSKLNSDQYGSRQNYNNSSVYITTDIRNHIKGGTGLGFTGIPPRNSSLHEMDSRRVSKNDFNDPFLQSFRGNSGLGAPLISLPGNTYLPQAQASKIQNSKIPYEEPVAVSYPNAHSRSPSPDFEKKDFASKYPTVESFDLMISDNNVQNQKLLAQHPLMPPKPVGISSAPSYKQKQAQNSIPAYGADVAVPPRMNHVQANQNQIQAMQRNPTPPDLPVKPSTAKRSPPLPPKPSKIETSKPILMRGQHPFVLPTSPVGNKFGVAGLRNLGNTCFMNSILQCLSATYPFSRYFMDGSYRKHIARNNPLSSNGRVTAAYASLIRSLWLADGAVVVPSELKSVIGSMLPSFAGNEQQDSQEFLSYLLDQLHEDLNVARRPFPANGPELDSENYAAAEFMKIEWNKYKARNWSIIVDMFQGVLQSVLRCLSCGKTSTTYNTFMYLSLPIPSHNQKNVKGGPVTIFECIENFLAPEKLTGGDQWKCPRCKVNRDAVKTLSITRLPTVLLIHFKRFSFQGPFRDKLETPIYFPVTRLDLSKYISPVNISAEVQQYSLVAVSNHFGGLNGGHYTAQIKHVHTEGWFNLDDSRVSELRENQVQSSAAYILFYLCTENKMGDWWSGTPR